MDLHIRIPDYIIKSGYVTGNLYIVNLNSWFGTDEGREYLLKRHLVETYLRVKHRKKSDRQS